MDPVREEIALLAKRVAMSTVQVKGSGPGGGSGIVWSGGGLVITNAHVARSDRVLVETTAGERLEGSVTRRDSRRDLAAIRIAGPDLAPAAVGDSSRLRVGELVVAVGHPLGVVNAASIGVVQSKPDRHWVRADVKLAPGNSGGPLVNADGYVVGVNSMIANGLAMAIPSNAVERFLRGQRGLIGVSLQPVAVAVEREQRLGLLVLDTAPGSAAERAGLMTGDILIAADGQAFSDPADLSEALDASNGALTLEWLRGGRWMRADVEPVLKARKEAA